MSRSCGGTFAPPGALYSYSFERIVFEQFRGKLQSSAASKTSLETNQRAHVWQRTET